MAETTTPRSTFHYLSNMPDMSQKRRNSDSDDIDNASHEAHLKVRVQRCYFSGFAAAKGSDGYFYIKQVPKGYTDVSVGDRILDINGVSQDNFRNARHANELLESFQLEM
jgi:hypothetical protein